MNVFKPMSPEKTKIEVEHYHIWIVVSNTDLTEGRGMETIIAYSMSKTTAERLAKGKGVQGTNAYVRPSTAYKLNNQWYVPICSGEMNYPNDQDRAKDTLEKRKQEVHDKALSLGLTEEEIGLL